MATKTIRVSDGYGGYIPLVFVDNGNGTYSLSTSSPTLEGLLGGVDSLGNALPVNFRSQAQVPAYNADGTLNTITITVGAAVYVQTMTYTSGNLTTISAWVKQ